MSAEDAIRAIAATSPANVVGSIYCADCNGLTEPLEADRV